MTSRHFLIAVLFAVTSLGVLTEAASSSDGTAADLARLPVPEAASLAEASKLIADVYKDDIAGATKPEQKTALASKLLATEAPAEKNPARRYALYVTARDIATDAGDADTSLAAIDALSDAYAIDPLATKLAALKTLTRTAKTPQQKSALLSRVEAVTDEAVSTDRYDVAVQLADLHLRAARQSGDRDLTARATMRTNSIQETATAYEKCREPLAVLEEQPTDPEANLAVGRFYCLVKGDWDKGLAMLALGSDEELKAVAAAEIGGVAGSEAQLALADRWEKLGQKATGTAQRQLTLHAAEWYRTALPELSAVDKRRVENWLKKVEATPQERSPQSFVNSIGMKLVRIRPGEFVMGSPANEEGRRDDETQHRVRITKAFMMGTTEVTQAQWKAVMGPDNNPSQFKGNDLPVEQVSWHDVQEFCRKLSEKERRTYRLPTEAEWEYACRAGTTTAFGGTGNLDNMGWYANNSGGTSHPVGQKQANAWGLYDMHGNVWEWCSDWYGAYPAGELVDPAGAANGGLRVLRGGSWDNDPRVCRSAFRFWNHPDGRRGFGFRVALVSVGVD